MRRRFSRPVALAVILTLALGACARVRSTVAGADSERAARDRAECEEQARKGLGTRQPVLGALGGGTLGFFAGGLAGAGVGAVNGLIAVSRTDRDVRETPAESGWIVGAMAALGFVVGSVLGTIYGVKHGVERAHAEDDRFARAYERCMTERGHAPAR